MNAYERRRRYSPVIWVLIAAVLLPPPTASAANRRINALSRDGKLETFRNPQFSNAASNRFLFTMGPTALVASGGDSFQSPQSRGYGSLAEPAAHWISYKGRLEWSSNDLALRGVGLPLIFQRMYRGSVSEYEGPLGNEWEFNWNKRIQYDAAGSPTRAWFYDLGRREEYVLDGGSYVSPIGRYDTLVRTGTPEYVRTDRLGVVETYEAEAYPNGDWFRLKEIEDLNGNRLAFFYDSNSHLTRVRDTLDQDTTLAYDSNDRITKITDPASREWIYAYDSGRLTSVRTPVVNAPDDEDDFLSGKTTTYKYDTAGLLTEICRPLDGGTGTWKWEYDASTRITKETRAGNDITLSYDDGNKSVKVTDREGHETVYFYDDGHEGNLITKRRVHEDALTWWESSFDYDAAGNVTRAIFPNGNRVEYVFDGNGNVVTVDFKKDGSDGGPVRWLYTWASHARLSTLRDPVANVWDYDYDGNGNLITKTAPAVTLPDTDHGTIREVWEYNARGLVTRVIDPVGTETETTYTTVNSLAAFPHEVVRDAGGLELTTTYLYDAVGNVTSVEDPNGNVTTYLVNALDQVLAAYEPLSVTRKMHYDGNDRLVKAQASNDTQTGNAWYVEDFVYDSQDNRTAVIVDKRDTDRLTTAYAYDKNDRVTKVTSPEGSETQYRYDERDLQVAVTRKAASSADDEIMATVYDGNGNALTRTDPRGFHTLYEYDGYDRLTKVTDPMGGTTETVHDSSGNVITHRQKNIGGTKLTETVLRYDEANRQYQTEVWAKKADLSTDIGDGWQTKTVHRDEAGRVLRHSGDVCGCAAFEHVYDAVGRQVTTKDPMGNTDGTRNLVLSFHDNNGNVTKSIRKERSQDTGIEADKDIETRFVYDARNRMVTRLEKLDGVTDMETVYFHGKRGQITKVIDGNGDERRTEHNEQLWTTKDIAENGAADVETQYDYDDDGRMITYRAKNSVTGDQETLYTYDLLGRLVTTTWPPNPTTALSTIQTWDKAGNRISTTDPMGTVVVAAYDASGRLTSQAITPGSGVLHTTSRSFGYDGANRMTSADSADGVAFASVVERTYNTLGEIETEKQVLDGYASGAGRTITHVYDIEGSRISTIYPVSGDTVHYARDAMDRVDKISKGAAELADYTFNGARRIKVTYPESFGLYTYDGYGRITDIHHKNTDSGNTLARFQYGWDESHQITAWDRHYYDDVQNTRITAWHDDIGSQFGYDGAKRLVSVLRGVPSNKMDTPLATNLANDDFRRFSLFAYDQTGNRLTHADDDGSTVDEDVWTHNKANEIATENAAAVTHNATGNFTGPSNKWGYDFENRLVQYLDDGDPTITHTWRFDALGRRVQWGNSSSARVFRFYYDGDQIVEHVSVNAGTETLRKQYIWGERLDDLVYYKDMTTETTMESWAHTDHLQSVQVLVDEAGDIREGYRYQEWGQTTVVDDSFARLTGTTSPISNNVRFTGRDQYTVMGDENDSFYHNRARVNRSRWGRWLQRDPEGYRESQQLYLYARSQPVKRLDKTGRLSITADRIPDIEIDGQGKNTIHSSGTVKCGYVVTDTNGPGSDSNCGVIIKKSPAKDSPDGKCGPGGTEIHLDTGLPGSDQISGAQDSDGEKCDIAPTKGGAPESLSGQKLGSGPWYGKFLSDNPDGGSFKPVSAVRYNFPDGAPSGHSESVRVTWTGNGKTKVADVVIECVCTSS